MVIELPAALKTTSSMNVRIKSRPRPPILTRSSWSIGWSNREVSKPGPSSPIMNVAAR